MRVRWVASTLALLVVNGPHATLHVRAQEPAEPTFRVTADLVTVDAIVFQGREPVTGLTVDDFEVFDNGVPQRIEAITVPGGSHVVAVVDTSASVAGDIIDNLVRALDVLLDSLSEDDRVSLVSFGDRIRILTRAAVPGPQLRQATRQLTPEGGTALHDAVVVGTALAAADSRPAVLVVFTDGADTASWTTAARTLELLRTSNVIVFTVGAGLAQLPAIAAQRVNRPYLTRRTWVAAEEADAPLILERMAHATGGTFLRVGAANALAGAFAQIVERYRQRYILSYEPTGVDRDDGWHTIEVRLKRQRGTVQAREGYFAGSR